MKKKGNCRHSLVKQPVALAGDAEPKVCESHRPTTGPTCDQQINQLTRHQQTYPSVEQSTTQVEDQVRSGAAAAASAALSKSAEASESAENARAPASIYCE